MLYIIYDTMSLQIKRYFMDTYIQVRIDKEDKDKAAKIFEEIGIDISTAVRMFLKKSIKVNGLPFSVNDSDDFDYLSTIKDINKNKN